jgi:hypothetical protein
MQLAFFDPRPSYDQTYDALYAYNIHTKNAILDPRNCVLCWPSRDCPRKGQFHEGHAA